MWRRERVSAGKERQSTSWANNVLSFLEDTFSKLSSRTVGLVRLDSGFFQSETLDYLEGKSLDYIDAAKFTHPIQRLVAGGAKWLAIDEGNEIRQATYESSSWTKRRRMIIVRQKISKRPTAPGKQLSLFEEDEQFRNYRYSACVTNLKMAASHVWRLYRNRVDAENRIKELNYDFGFNSFNLNGFYATEAALTLAIGANFKKIEGKIGLNLDLQKKRRAWFSRPWRHSKLKISNA